MSEFFPMINTDFFVALGSILFLNLILSGDNAVVIAMSSKNLPAAQRNKAIFFGTIGAVVLRVMLTFAAAMLLNIPYLQFLGGVALLWIAINLLDQKDDRTCAAASSLQKAIQIILFADLIMSLDNVLALAAIAQTAPQNKYLLIILGLATSIPLVVFGAQLLVKILDRFPFAMYVGSAILGYAAAELMLSDSSVGYLLEMDGSLLEIILTLGVVLIGFCKKRISAKKATKENKDY